MLAGVTARTVCTSWVDVYYLVQVGGLFVYIDDNKFTMKQSGGLREAACALLGLPALTRLDDAPLRWRRRFGRRLDRRHTRTVAHVFSGCQCCAKFSSGPIRVSK